MSSEVIKMKGIKPLRYSKSRVFMNTSNLSTVNSPSTLAKAAKEDKDGQTRGVRFAPDLNMRK